MYKKYLQLMVIILISTALLRGETGQGLSPIKPLSTIPTVTLTTPNGGEIVDLASTFTITWTSSNITNVKLEYTTDNGTSWNSIISSLPDSEKTFAWTVPNTPSTNCKVKISELNNATVFDESDSLFIIISSQFPWRYVSNTGKNAIIGIPSAISPKLGNDPIATSDVIGVFFTRNDSLICAGYGIWNDGQSLSITVWGDDDQTQLKDGFAESEVITYKVWQNSSGKVFDGVVTYQSGGPNFTTNGIMVLSSLIAREKVEHKIILNKGWNMISSYIIPQVSTLDTVLKRANNNLVIMKNGLGNVYWPALGINSIGEWQCKNGYQIYMNAADTLIIAGEIADPITNPIVLGKGWNLSSYLRSKSLSPQSALADIETNLVIAKNGAGQVYWPLLGINTIGQMQFGDGYQMYMNNADTLFYPANTLLAKVNLITEVKEPQHYKFVNKNTGSNGILLIEVSGIEEDDEIGIYGTSDGLIGSGVIEKGRAIITVWGDNEITKTEREGAKETENLKIKIWSSKEQHEKEANIKYIENVLSEDKKDNTLQYEQDMVKKVGIEIKEEIPTTFSLEQNFPNPFNPSTTIRFSLPQDIKVQISIYNQLGEKVAELLNDNYQAGMHEISWNAQNLSSGVYFIELKTPKFSSIRKLILLK